MVWMVNQQVTRGRRSRIWGVTLLCLLFIMLVTPKIPLSYRNNLYADMRNFLGVPNTLNVIPNFPFLIVGVLGFVLCLGGGSFFNIRLRGEVWGWVLFYGGIASVAFGSAYYHLRPDGNRIMLDTLPLIPCIAIPIMAFLFPPKYTHSRYWLLIAGVCIIAKMEALADMKIYRANNYIISGHSLEHLCSAIAPVLATVMLMQRSSRFERLGEIKECP